VHIPDGYLSPASCTALYAGSAPFWYVALRRMKRAMNTQMIPLVSVFSAFSFIVMMFNLPLPGGTTGHATGLGIATIVLGPWAAMLAISVALIIQAVFFGDGGITTIGANCFNMAILGSLAVYVIYRMISGRATLTSPRRVVAGALAGYISINLSALITAVELGIQPLYYHDSTGAPLYAPYPLHITIPAMLIGHLTVVGVAEMVITGGVVAYLQRAEPSLLRLTAPGARVDRPDGKPAGTHGTHGTRRLWVALAILMILTPLGIIAAGKAWGEWSPDDFSNQQTRGQIAAASGNQPLPAEAPTGLRHFGSVWTAPMPGYAPRFLKSAGFGYMLSAAAGTGVIILVILLAGWIFERRAA